jgi:hypothetical protein
MRSFLVLLLVLALPINGMAQLLMPVGSSAHHVMPDRVGIEAMAASHASMAGVSGAEHECCEANEHGTATVCKTGQECKTASILQLVSVKAVVVNEFWTLVKVYPASDSASTGVLYPL